MFRFVFRVLATISLAVAVIMAVIDATRSIAASAWVLTPLAESWQAVAPGSYAAAEAFTRDAMLPELWDPIALAVLSLPGFAIFLVLALLFYLVGRRPERRRLGRFAVN
jgi:hypothetical protein